MAKRTKDHQTWLIEKLTDPRRASDYLNAAREDSREMFLEALRDVAQARQMATVARDAGVTRESLYRATSEIGNPTLETFDRVLAALGIKYQFTPTEVDEPAQTPVGGTVYSIEEAVLNVAALSPRTPPLKHLQNAAGIGRSQFSWEISCLTGIGLGSPRATAEQAELALVPGFPMYQPSEPEYRSQIE